MIDSTALLSLITVQDQESFILLKDLENIFSKQTPKIFQQMHCGIETADNELILRAAHTLKTSCRYLGLTEMVEICFQIECNASQTVPDHSKIAMLIQKLENAFLAGLTELNALVLQIGDHLSDTGHNNKTERYEILL